MKKISTLAIALIAMGSLATPVSAQNIMPKVSTEGGATYTYYLQGAGLTSSCYASKEVGSDNNVKFTKDKTERFFFKLVASASNYNIVTANLETTKYIGCNNTTIAPDGNDKTNGYVRYYDDAATNAAWVVAKNTSSNAAAMNNYYPYYAIKPSANNNASWNTFGGAGAVNPQVRLHGKADQGSNWNFIPADVATLKAWADDAKAEIDALTTTADKNSVLTAIQAAQNATEADVDSKAKNLLSAYTSFFKQVKLATIAATTTEFENDYNAHKGQAGYATEASFAAYKAKIQSVTTENTYDQIASAASAAVSAITEVNMPADGKVYVFTNVQKNGARYYLKYVDDNLKALERGEESAENLDDAAKFVCRVVDGKYVFVNVKDGKYLIYKTENSSYGNGENSGKGYIDTYAAGYADLSVSKHSTYPCLNIIGKRSDSFPTSYFILNTNGSYNAYNKEGYTDGYSTAFLFEEVSYPNTIAFNKVSDVEGVKSIATFSAPFATVIPEGVTAYYVSTADNSTATMKAITGKAIPAKTGVILTSQSGDAVTMVPATDETLATIENNKLGNSAGAEKTIAEGDNAYILAGGANGTAFYKGTVGTTLKANKAYLTLNVAGGEAISMNFGGNVTGINQIVNAEQNNAPIYDLTGRRVVRTVKGGLYIKGGNKFIAR